MPNWKKLITSGSDASLASLNVAGAVVANTLTGSLNIPDSSTLGIGSQTFYPQGTNGFSVNEDFDPSNSSLQTAYHYTSGTGRETVAFTLARTGQFTDGFGIYGTSANNTFVTFGEQNNTNFEWRRGIGIRPLDLDGGTLLARLSGSGVFWAPTLSGSFVGNGSGLTGLSAGIFAKTGSSQNTTNNLEITGSVTATSFIGDGSGLSNVVANVSETATITDTFTNTTTKTVTHSFGTKNVLVSTYNSSDQQIIPASVTTTDNDNVVVTFDTNTSGRVVVAKGGHIVSGSASDSTNLDGQPGSYYLNYNNFTNVPTGIVSGSAQIDSLTRYEESITGNTSYTITHSLGEDYPIVQVYDGNKDQVIPSNVRATNENTVTLTFDTNFTGRVVIKK